MRFGELHLRTARGKPIFSHLEGVTTASQGKAPLLASRAMIRQGNKWLTEWIEGMGRLTLLARETISRCSRRKYRGAICCTRFISSA